MTLDFSSQQLLNVPFEVKFAEGDTPGVIEGYASVFDLLDLGGDVVRPGAFRKTLGQWRKRKAQPPMLWQHDHTQPIGVWTEIGEDDKGLKVRGELILEVPQGAAAYALLKRRAIRGLSIGYRTVTAEVDRVTGARALKEVELWEISLATVPMLPEATISAVKTDQTFNPRQMEDALREAGLSRSDRVRAVAVFKSWLQREAGGPGRPSRDGMRDTLMALRRLETRLRG